MNQSRPVISRLHIPPPLFLPITPVHPPAQPSSALHQSFANEVRNSRQGNSFTSNAHSSIDDSIRTNRTTESRIPLQPLTNSFGDPNFTTLSIEKDNPITRPCHLKATTTRNQNVTSSIPISDRTRTNPTDDLNASLSSRIRNLNDPETTPIPLSPTEAILSALPGYLVEATEAQLIAELPKCQTERLQLRDKFGNPLIYLEHQLQQNAPSHSRLSDPALPETFDKAFKTTQRHQQFAAFFPEFQ